MLKNELLTTILNDYLAENSLSDQAHAAIESFCLYAGEWLHANKPVGLGHAFSDGLSVRFADGKELLLFETAMVTPPSPPAMSITGTNSGSVRAAGALVDSSRGITGDV